jgi:hypothetical protein
VGLFNDAYEALPSKAGSKSFVKAVLFKLNAVKDVDVVE